MPLYDVDNNLITPYLQATPGSDTIKVVNRLLNGQYHIQVIGEPAPVLRCSVIVNNGTAKDIIDTAHGSGVYLKAVSRGKYWIGPIMDDGVLDWAWRGADVWEVRFTLSVIQQGVI